MSSYDSDDESDDLVFKDRAPEVPFEGYALYMKCVKSFKTSYERAAYRWLVRSNEIVAATLYYELKKGFPPCWLKGDAWDIANDNDIDTVLEAVEMERMLEELKKVPKKPSPSKVYSIYNDL